MSPTSYLYRGDVSTFSGMNGELRVTTVARPGFEVAALLDDIAFSPIPEPNTLALLTLGGASFGVYYFRRRP